MKKGILIVACVLGLAGCQTMTPEEQQLFATFQATAKPSLAPSSSPFIQDRREPRSREYYNGSLLIHDCTYGVVHFGDRGAAADKIARLERDLLAAFGPELVEEPVILRQYSVYHNGAQALIGMSVASQGAIGHALGEAAKGKGTGQRPKCSREKMSMGWFDQADLTSSASPFVVDIDISIQGKDFRVNSAFSPPSEITSPGVNRAERPEWVAGIQGAMEKANARLIEAIKASATG